MRITIGGRVGERISNVTSQWLTVALRSNPAMLEMFRDRDRTPGRNLVPWAGEFAGKHLVSAVQVWRVTRDESLRTFLADFVRRLTELQAENGYLGPFPKNHQLTGVHPERGRTWDAWGHYHVMLGLLYWNEDSGDPAALDCARRIGDLFCRKFERERLVDIGSSEMNLAPIHSLCLLHRRTSEERYLKLALRICDEFSARDDDGKPLAGDYLEAALAGKEFFESPRPRWESLHPIMGLAELYRITGEERYLRAFSHWWWSVVRFDRHNNGGFSSGEQAQGNPYHPGAIETCCSIAWTALTVEMLRLTRNSIVADELELTLLNSVMGLHSPSGRWVSYDTPMDGCRKASGHDIVFQARAGSPELNCCSVNGPRGFGLISDWAVMSSGSELFLNWYGPAAFEGPLPTGGSITLRQETGYPLDPRIRLTVTTSKPEVFTLNLRIPHWSADTGVKVNGVPVPAVSAGSYLRLAREWRAGDVIELELDFSLHFWTGERECEGKASIYRGPVLLAFDRRFNAMDAPAIPALEARRLRGRTAPIDGWLPPMVLMEFTAVDGQIVRLCDFASAGADGTDYRSWLDVRGTSVTAFSPTSPWRTSRCR